MLSRKRLVTVPQNYHLHKEKTGKAKTSHLSLFALLCAPNENYAKIINAIVTVLMFDSPWQTPQYIYRLYAINIVSIQSLSIVPL